MEGDIWALVYGERTERKALGDREDIQITYVGAEVARLFAELSAKYG